MSVTAQLRHHDPVVVVSLKDKEFSGLPAHCRHCGRIDQQARSATTRISSRTTSSQLGDRAVQPCVAFAQVSTAQRIRSASASTGVNLPLEHHAARADHGQPVAVRRGLGRIAGHAAVRAAAADELLKVGEQVIRASLAPARAPSRHSLGLTAALSITDSSVACRPEQPPGSQGGVKVLGSSVRVLLPGRCPNGQGAVAYLDHTRLSSLPSPVRPTRPRRLVRRYSILGRFRYRRWRQHHAGQHCRRGQGSQTHRPTPSDSTRKLRVYRQPVP